MKNNYPMRISGTILKKWFLCFVLPFIDCAVLLAQAEPDSVTVSGTVTDFGGNPLDSVSVWFKRADFSDVASTCTNAAGFYRIRVPKGKYRSVVAVNPARYAHTAQSGLAEKEQRLECWAWNFIAGDDTAFDMRCHRMEAYGMHAFRIPGAAPGYVIYVRPMGLTRYYKWLAKKAPAVLLAPPPEQQDVKVTINGEEVPLRMKQEIKEYASPGSYVNAYLLTVGLPQRPSSSSYTVFKVELTDLENGDRGEGFYFLEKDIYR